MYVEMIQNKNYNFIELEKNFQVNCLKDLKEETNRNIKL